MGITLLLGTKTCGSVAELSRTVSMAAEDEWQVWFAATLAGHGCHFSKLFRLALSLWRPRFLRHFTLFFFFCAFACMLTEITWHARWNAPPPKSVRFMPSPFRGEHTAKGGGLQIKTGRGDWRIFRQSNSQLTIFLFFFPPNCGSSGAVWCYVQAKQSVLIAPDALCACLFFQAITDS